MSVADESERPVAAAVVVHEGRLLLVRRRIAEGQLSWQFPAGKVDPDESREAAAVREAQEETGLRVVARELLGERLHPATGRLTSYTACDVLSGTAYVATEREVAEVGKPGSSPPRRARGLTTRRRRTAGRPVVWRGNRWGTCMLRLRSPRLPHGCGRPAVCR